MKYIKFLPLLLLTGCDMALMDPKGQIGVEQKSLILTSTWLMLIVVIPVILMTIFFAWKYRASNKKAEYKPEWSHSTKIEIVVWTIPCLIIVALGIMTWQSSHELDPQKPLSDVKPVKIEVVAMDWKWLFIYPEEGIATVNEIAFPANVPVEFHVTSATVMNSFFIPRLGSQIYAMAGMENKLNLIANAEGEYPGISANYSGAGFSGMQFKAIATSKEGYANWVQKVKQAPDALTIKQYQGLLKASENTPVQHFASVQPKLFQSIIQQYMPSAMPGMYQDLCE
jgi:cytochrome o ubiquinol oxidase subunit 2